MNVGRLFWKFFFFFLLAQVTTTGGVAAALWLRHLRIQSEQARVGGEPPGAALADAAAAALEHGGEPSLRALLAGWAKHRMPPVYAIDTTGNEVLGRTPPPIPAAAASIADPPAPVVRRVELGSGATWQIIVADDGPRPHAGPPKGPADGRSGGPEHAGRPDRPPPQGMGPLEPLAGGLAASLLFAALLAAYVAKPIGSLREGFAAAARGVLDYRLPPQIKRRRDELADLGRDFERTSARLKALMDGQRRLLHDVSHELRSPLARLQAAVGLARQQPEAIEASMDRIEREAGRMDALIDELLMLSRLEAGALVADADDVPLADLLREVADDARFEAAALGRPVTIELAVNDADTIRTAGRAELLQRAFDNIVRNALRHAGTPGLVAITAAPAPDRRSLRITVRDDGDGIPPEDLPSLFVPFFRGANATGTQGHGLGLALARTVVIAHGGTIAAANGAAGGFVVEITLPIAPRVRERGDAASD